jgi:hypothetical protein
MSSSMSFYTGRYTGATTDYIEEKRKMDDLLYELSLTQVCTQSRSYHRLTKGEEEV